APSGGFHQLQPVAERIADVTTVEALQRHVVRDAVPGGLDPSSEGLQVLYQEGRVRLPRRRERLLDTEMYLQVALPEPDAAARRQLRRLRDLLQPEDRAVEAPGRLLLTRWHRELNVVQP